MSRATAILSYSSFSVKSEANPLSIEYGKTLCMEFSKSNVSRDEVKYIKYILEYNFPIKSK